MTKIYSDREDEQRWRSKRREDRPALPAEIVFSNQLQGESVVLSSDLRAALGWRDQGESRLFWGSGFGEH